MPPSCDRVQENLRSLFRCKTAPAEHDHVRHGVPRPQALFRAALEAHPHPGVALRILAHGPVHGDEVGAGLLHAASEDGRVELLGEPALEGSGGGPGSSLVEGHDEKAAGGKVQPVQDGKSVLRANTISESKINQPQPKANA